MTGTRQVLVLAPMTSELKPLVKYTRAQRTNDSFSSHRARFGDVDVVMLRVGVGPEVARRNTAQALERFQVDYVIVSGIAGGLAPDLPVGGVIVPDAVVDLGTGREFRPAALDGLTAAGTVGVADHLITDRTELERLRDQGVAALEMESSGVAEACDGAGIPWTTVRVIGDRPDEGLTDDAVMSFLRPDGTADAGGAVRFMVTHPRRIPDLLRLGRDSAMAASKAARVTLEALGWNPG